MLILIYFFRNEERIDVEFHLTTMRLAGTIIREGGIGGQERKGELIEEKSTMQ